MSCCTLNSWTHRSKWVSRYIKSILLKPTPAHFTIFLSCSTSRVLFIAAPFWLKASFFKKVSEPLSSMIAITWKKNNSKFLLVLLLWTQRSEWVSRYIKFVILKPAKPCFCSVQLAEFFTGLLHLSQEIHVLKMSLYHSAFHMNSNHQRSPLPGNRSDNHSRPPTS